MQLRFTHGIAGTLLLICLSILFGCKSAPVPPEVAIAETQEHELWRAGAETFTPSEYKAYRTALRNGKDLLIKEQGRFVWFRDYESVRKEFVVILANGNSLLEKLLIEKQASLNATRSRLDHFRERIETFKRLTTIINEGRLARRQLMSAELLLKEAESLSAKEKFSDADKKLRGIPVYLASAQEAIAPVLNRYADRGQIEKWRRWVNETIQTSREKGNFSIFVSKLDRKLVLYKGGVPYKTYSVGLGKNGFHDKRHAGDHATPEGKYHITRKIPRSRYYKALLINYPNEEDQRQFAAAKRKGLIPARAGIGGLIEIHGGGTEGMTQGCIAMDDRHVAELYDLVDVGTPVTIVGAIDYDNIISSSIKDM